MNKLIEILERIIAHPYWCRCFQPQPGERSDLLRASRCRRCGKWRAESPDKWVVL